MAPARKVVVRDKYPVVDEDILRRPLNRAVLAAAMGALALQGLALAQDIWGSGGSPGPLGPAPYALVAFLWLALGGLVFLQRRARYAGQFFLLSAAAGSVFLSFAPIRRSLTESCIFAAGLLLFPALLLSFVRAFDETRPWRWRPARRSQADVVLFVPALALIWPVGDALFRSDVTGPVWRVGLGLAGFYLLATIVQAGRDTRAMRSPARASQLRALLFGLIAGTLISVPIFLVPVIVGGQKVQTTWLPLLVLLFLLAVGYTVLLRELDEVDFFLRRGIVYGVMTLGILVAYAVLGLVLAAGRATVAGVSGGLGFVAVAVAVGAGFAPVRRGVRRLIDWLVFGERVDRWDLLQALSERLGVVMAPAELGAALTQEIGAALLARSAFLLVRDESGSPGSSGGRFVVSQEMRREERGRSVIGRQLDADVVEAALGDPPAPLVLIHARPLLPSRRESVPERFLPLHRLHVSLAAPLVTRSGLQAVLCLRAKRTHEGFNAGDLSLLAPVLRQAAGALDTALLFAQLEEKVTELRAAYGRLAHEQESERARLAGELHDGIAQELATLITLTHVTERQLNGELASVRGHREANSPHATSARETLARLRAQAEATYGEVRRVSHALRPVLLEDYGLAPSLRRYLESFGATSGIAIDADVQLVSGLSPVAELALFRVAQESLENARKHSGSERAAVSLSNDNGRVVLRVTDAGRGLAGSGSGRGSVPAGLGLVGMRERIEAVGGSLSIESAEGRGTCIEAVVPVEEP